MMVHIRAAQPGDAEGVLALAGPFATSFVVEAAAFHGSYAELIGSPGAYVAVAEDAGRLIGYVLGFVHLTFFANGPVAWVEEITVSEDARGQGVGRLLMETFERWAAERRCRLVALATRRAAPFYVALGYEDSATYFRKLL